MSNIELAIRVIGKIVWLWSVPAVLVVAAVALVAVVVRWKDR